jgi:hypothetical protein
MGSSGIQSHALRPTSIIEGIRAARVVRVRPAGWPQVQVPREEYVGDGSGAEDRFPTPVIFPKY